MSQAVGEMKSLYAFVERQFNLVKRYLGWEIVFLVYTIVNALTIGFIGVTQGKDTVLYLVVGAMLWGFLSILFHEVSESVSWERWEGTIEYTFMAPVHRFTHLGGMCLYAILYGVVRTGVLLLAVALFFHLDLQNANFVAALVILVVSSLSFIGLGLMAAILPLMSPEKGSQATHIFQAVLLLVSGVYYETSILPSWIRPFSAVSPATYTLRAMRAALLEGRPLGEMWVTLLLLLATGVLLIPLGLFIFHQAEIFAKKSGKLKRSG
jgi:ABC-2 type transport system permease protein